MFLCISGLLDVNDDDAGKINVASPLAQGLMGSKVGQKISVDVPAGKMNFEILEVRFDD